MEKDLNILKSILISLFVMFVLALLYDNIYNIKSINDSTAALWSAIGTVVQAIGGLIQIYIAWSLWKITEKQADISKKQADIAEYALQETKKSTEISLESFKLDRQAMIQDQRPWLKVKINEQRKGNFQWQLNSSTADFFFDVTNIGKSPAIDVMLYFKFEPRPYGGTQEIPYVWPHTKQEIFAKSIANKFDPNYPSYTIFPGDTETIWKMGGTSDAFHRPIDIPEFLNNINAQHTDKFHGYTMMGVVFYKYLPDGQTYETGILFEISAPNGVFVGRDLKSSDFRVDPFIIGRARIT